MTVDPSLLSQDALAAMAAAGDRLAVLEAGMRRARTNPRALLLDGAEAEEFRHYPTGDAYDFSSHSQFYFHAHRVGEYGHIHLFLRPLGMPAGLRPKVSGGGEDSPCHLLAVGLGHNGFASELFTTNRWVTGESWYDYKAVTAMLPCFFVDGDGAKGQVGRWLTALLALYRPLAASLAERRDESVAAWAASHPGKDPLDDGDLEITSRAAIETGVWRQAIRAARKLD